MLQRLICKVFGHRFSGRGIAYGKDRIIVTCPRCEAELTIGVLEDLSVAIYDIAPMDTPFMRRAATWGNSKPLP